MSVRKRYRRVWRWAVYYKRYARATTVAPPGFSRAWGAWLKERNRAWDLRERREMPSWSRSEAEQYD